MIIIIEIIIRKEEYEGKITVYKVNIDDLRDLATEFDVMSIPNMIFFKDGEESPAFFSRKRVIITRSIIYTSKVK